MANIEGTYSPADEASSPFDPIPVGKYLGMLVESEMKETANKDGRFLNLTFEILDGPFKGRKLWDRLNLQNKSVEAVQIAKAKFAALRQAVGVLQPKDSVELHNLPLIIDVKQRKRDDTGEIQNDIRGYSKKESAAPASSPMTTNAAAPWKR